MAVGEPVPRLIKETIGINSLVSISDKYIRVRLPATSQLYFCSLIFVDYVLILYDYQMAFSSICPVVYALGLVRLISRCYTMLQCSMHPNHCLLVPGLSIPFGFPFILACSVLACITLFYWSSLCSCRATVRIPSSDIRIPSSSCYVPHR